MRIKKFNNFLLKEDVQQDLQDRVTQLETVRNQVKNIVNVIPTIKNLDDPEQIDQRMEQLSNQYQNNDDSMISLALTFTNKIADYRKLELKIQEYENEIPDLQNQIDEKLQELVQEIQDLKNS